MKILTLMERKGLEERLERLVQKRDGYQRDFDLESSAGKRLTFEAYIKDTEAEIEEVKTQLGYPTTLNASAYAHLFKDAKFKPRLGPFITVNCNRDKHYLGEGGLRKKVNRAKESGQNLLCLIAACPDQNPFSLANRLVFDLVESEVVTDDDDSDNELVSGFRNDEYKEKFSYRPIKFRGTPAGTWAKIWGEVEYSIAKKVKYPTPAALAKVCDAKHIALFFSIDEDDWLEQDDALEHLRYMVAQFEQKPGEIWSCQDQKYLIFIVVECSRIDSERSEQLESLRTSLSDFSQNTHQNPDNGLHAVYYECLPPVDTDSIKKWARKVTENSETDNIRLIEHLKQQIASSELARLKGSFDMKDVEKMQNAAFEIYQSRPFNSNY